MSVRTLIKKSISASILIGLGDFILLKIGQPLGAIFFSLGLLGVCYMGEYLFTGKCGFLWEDKLGLKNLMIILAVNLVAGYLFGLVCSCVDSEIAESALIKVAGWEFSWVFLVKAILCGAIMYIAVKMFRQGTPLGILIGVPLFIMCGFQHSIANVITLGMAGAWDWSLVLAVIGNFVGSGIMTWLDGNKIICPRSDCKPF